jgi:hypothetical protein
MEKMGTEVMRMRKISVLAACVLSTGALANPSMSPRFEGKAGLIPDKRLETFYTQKMDPSWTVFGIDYFVEGRVYPKGPICALENAYKDGSLFQLSVPVADHREGKPPPFKLYFKDNTWEIAGPYPQQAALQLNMFKGKQLVGGGELKFTIMSKNGILINGIAGQFAISLEQANKLVFVMPGTIKNSTVYLPNIRLALNYFVLCQSAYLDLNEDKKGDEAEPSNKNDGP